MGRKWTNKLFVKANVPGSGNILIAPVINVSPANSTPHTWEHGLNKDNQNPTRGNFTYNCTITVRALKDNETLDNPVNVLTKIAQLGLEFDILIGEQIIQEGGVKQYAFDQLGYEKCYVNSDTHALNMGASPTATFNMVCGAINIDGESYNGSSNETP
jgi:hypothetical protein